MSASLFAQQQLMPGNQAPEFTAIGLDGRQYSLSQFHGKVVVLTFWSSKCAICHHEIPKLNQVVERYQGQDVVFLALTMESDSKVNSYIQKYPFNFSILPNGFGVVLKYADMDKSGRINMGFPAHFLINRRGEIELRTDGWDKTANLESNISRLLAAD